MPIFNKLVLIFLFIFSFQSYSSDCIKLINNIFRKAETKIVLPEESRFTSLGLEVEGVINSKYSFLDVANSLAESLKNTRDQVEVVSLSDEGEYAVRFKNENESEWKTISLLLDSSLQDTETKRGLEVTSPVMKSNQDILDQLDVINHIKRNFEFEEVDTGGIHVHYGVKDFPLQSLVRLKKFYFMLGQQLESAVKFHPNRTLSGNDRLREDIIDLERVRNTELAKVAQEGLMQNNTLIKYSDKYETIENKIFNSSVDQATISNHLKQTVDLFYSVLNDPRFFDETSGIYNKHYQASEEEIRRIDQERHDALTGNQEDEYLNSIFNAINSVNSQ